MSQELGYIPYFSKVRTLLRKGAIILISSEVFDATRYFQMFLLKPNTFSRLVILLGNPSCFIYWVCGNYMVAQILCISISREPNDFLISYFSRGCSLSFNAFPGCLFGCFQFEEAPPELLIFFHPSGLRRFNYDFQQD